MVPSAVRRGVEPSSIGLREVVGKIVKKMGLKIESLDAIPDDEFAEGYYYNGPAKTALTSVLEPRGVTSYEVAGIMQFARREEQPAAGEFLLTKQTGLIGSPSVTENDGARAKMALNDSIELGQIVVISSDALDGRFKVRSVVHRGDSWGGEFVTEIKGERDNRAVGDELLALDLTGGFA